MKEELVAAFFFLIVFAVLLWFGVKDLVMHLWNMLKKAWEELDEDSPARLSERIFELEATLGEVLDAWKREADQGDGISEEHSRLYEHALAVRRGLLKKTW